MAIAGGCRCGGLRYVLETGPAPACYACHCLNCQTMSGGGFVIQLPVLEARLRIEGAATTWRAPSARGGETSQRFCATCMTRIFSTNTTRPGVALLRGGTLDDSQNLSPSLHIWTKRTLPWITLPKEVPSFAEAAPAEVTTRLFAHNFAPL